MVFANTVCVHAAGGDTGPYDFKDTRTSGFVEIVKSWVQGNTDSPPP